MAQQCKAHNRKGDRCGRPVVPGREVCRYHGGLTPRGAALPQYKHGRYSKSLPSRLASQFLESINDENLLVLDDEIALVDTRIHELLTRLDESQNRTLWVDLSNAYRQIKDAMKTGNSDMLVLGVGLLESVLGRRERYELWDELFKASELKRRLIESRRAHLIEEQQVISAEAAMTMVSALLESVNRAVTDNPTRAAIEREFATITGALYLPGIGRAR